ncbi:MAG: O-antigen ligase family protein [Eubacterium sp.]|nr:O-antigen ligase family protein [Eubacterium sp.]
MEKKNRDYVLYITTAYMVFLAVYTLGLRISLWATGWDMISGISGLLDLYRISIVGCGLLGVLIFVTFLRRNKGAVLKPDVIILAALLLWMCVSAVMNRDLGLKENLSGVIDIAVTVVTFYLVGKMFGKNKLMFILRRVMIFAVGVWDVGCIVSLGMYISNYWGYFRFNGFLRASRQGIMEGRLFGCFSDPNYAAMISCLLMMIMLYMLRCDFLKEKKGIIGLLARVYFKSGVGLCGVYIALSGSRSTLVAMTVTLAILVIINTYNKRKSEIEKDRFGKIKGNPIWIYTSRVIAACVVLIAVNYGILFSMQGIGYVANPERDMSIEFDRDDVSAENISNSRFQIWVDYLTLVKDRPVTGLSTRGALVYARQLDPTSYLSTMGYNPHSMFVQMGVQAGIIGFLLMLAFLFRALVRIVKLVREKYADNFTLLLIAIICVHGVYCAFNVGIFITPCVEAMLAWIALGNLEKQCGSLPEKKNEKATDNVGGVEK